MEIPERASKRGHFRPAERWALLLEFDKCLDRGSKVAFYRKVGVAESTVKTWVRARAEGRLKGPDEQQPPRSVRSLMTGKERREFTRLEHENAAYKLRLEQSEATVDILKKASALLDSLARSATMPKVEELPPKASEGWPDWLNPRNDGRP